VCDEPVILPWLPARDENGIFARLTMDAARIGTFEFDVASGVVHASERLLSMFGLPNQQTPIRHWIARVPAQDRRALHDIFDAAAQKFGECAAEFRIMHPSGMRWVRAAASILRGSNGRPARVLGIAQDITAPQGAGEAMQQSEDRLRRMIAEAPVPALLHSADGKILAISRVCSEISGYTMKHARTVAGWCARALGLASFADGEFKVRTATGKIRIWDLRTIPAGQDGAGCNLFAVIATDLTEQRREEARSRRREEQLQALTARMISAQEEERRRVSRDLHDDIGQRLAVMNLEIGRLIGGGGVFVSDILPNLTQLQQQFMLLATDCRKISRQLHSAVLEEAGLEPALRTLCADFENCCTFTVSFATFGPSDEIGQELQLALYRVAQEGLRNASKHSRARHVTVSLQRRGRRLDLSVHDDGVGFRTAGKIAGLGIVSMRERMRAVRGELAIESQCGRGTVVRASVPLRGGDHAAAPDTHRRGS
jgi:PAS domain S-box-containing protein